MAVPAILADENIADEIVAWLRAKGLVVLLLEEVNLLHATDTRIFGTAAEQGWLVLSHDQDMGEIAARYFTQKTQRVLLLRPGHINPKLFCEALDVYWANGELPTLLARTESYVAVIQLGREKPSFRIRIRS